MAPCSPGILSPEFRPLPGPSGLGGTRLQHLLLAPWQCLQEPISEGRRGVCLLTPKGPQAHYQLHHQGETVLPAPPAGTVPGALEHFQGPQGHLKPKKKKKITTEI